MTGMAIGKCRMAIEALGRHFSLEEGWWGYVAACGNCQDEDLKDDEIVRWCF